MKIETLTTSQKHHILNQRLKYHIIRKTTKVSKNV